MELYDENDGSFQANDTSGTYGQFGQSRNYNNEQYPSFPPFDLEKLLWNEYNDGKGAQRNNYAVSMRMKLDSYSRYLQVVNLSHLQHQSSSAAYQVSEENWKFISKLPFVCGTIWLAKLIPILFSLNKVVGRLFLILAANTGVFAFHFASVKALCIYAQ